MSCQICNKPYDNSTECRPYLIVPCTHSYCVGCLNQLTKQKHVIYLFQICFKFSEIL